jgi:hypothetical protein
LDKFTKIPWNTFAKHQSAIQMDIILKLKVLICRGSVTGRKLVVIFGLTSRNWFLFFHAIIVLNWKNCFLFKTAISQKKSKLLHIHEEQYNRTIVQIEEIDER